MAAWRGKPDAVVADAVVADADADAAGVEESA